MGRQKRIYCGLRDEEDEVETRLDLQFEESIRNLQHEDMWVTMIMHDEDTLYCPAHTKVFIIVL